jgi:hypothetical protein
MFAALLYLTTRTALNRLVGQVKRVRQPRYAIAIVVGVAYFWYFLIAPSSSRGEDNPFSFLTSENGQDLITVGVFLLFASSWLTGRRADALAFSPAEVHFLFPAPVTRRWLLFFKLARSQLAILIGTIIWMFLLRRGGGDLNPLARAVGLWLLFATLAVHQLMAALVHVSAVRRGAFGGGQRTLTVALAAVSALYTWAAYAAWQTASAGATGRGPARFVETLSRVVEDPLLAALISPFRAVAAPVFATSMPEWLSAAPVAALILALHLAAILTFHVPFEENAAEASTRVAKKVADFRARGIRAAPQPSARTVRGTAIPLRATGNPMYAIIWKNGLAFIRSFRATSVLLVFVFLLPVLIVGLMVSDRSAAIMIASSMAMMLVAWSIILGPRFIRNDLRADLTQLSLLKTFPLSGSRIVGAEVASATLSLTAVQLILVLIIAALMLIENRTPVSSTDLLFGLAVAPVCLAAINSLNLSIHNGATLMFPGWMTLGMNRPSGVEAMGQNLLLLVASVILLAIALIPVAVAGAGGYFLLAAAPARIRFLIAIIAGAVVLGSEVWLLMKSLGRLFERTEPSALG